MNTQPDLGALILRARAYLRAHGTEPAPVSQTPSVAVAQLLAQVLDVAEDGQS